MKYKGYIFHRVKLVGKIFKRINLNAKVETRELFGKVGIYPRILVKGSMQVRPGRSGSIKWLDVRYAFTSAVSTIVTKCKAALSAGKAKEVKADTAVRTESDVNLTSNHATQITAKKDIRTVSGVKLVAYFKAGMVYMKKVLTSHNVNLTRAKGAIARYKKKVATKHTADIAKAETSVTECFRIVGNEVTANCSKAPANDGLGVDKKTQTETTATASTAGATGIGINSVMPSAKHTARLSCWYPYEQDGDTLSMTQIFSGVQNYDTLEIDLEETSAYWANAFNENGVMTLVFAQTEPQNGNILEVV